MPRSGEPELFDEIYFRQGCGIPYERNAHWLEFFGSIAETIKQTIAPQTVLDAGCAMGFLVEELRERGIQAFGIDVSEYALNNVRADIKPFCQRASVVEPLPQRYDLIVCIEVLEHLAASESTRAVKNLCTYSSDILFSSTPLDYKEATHFNVQPTEYWAELFARHNLFRDVDYDASFITPWAVRFRRSQEPVARLARDYERRYWALWKENVDLRGWTGDIRAKLAQDEERLAQDEKKIHELTTQTQEQQELLGARQAALVEQKALIMELKAAIAEKEQNIENLCAQVAEKERAIQSLRDEIGTLRNSLIWRIMSLFQQLRKWLFPPR